MSSKKRKLAEKMQVFQEKWILKYFFVQFN
jgi:hypothetical protein